MFANQFKRITRVILRVFILKVANSGPRVTIYERNEEPGTNLTDSTVPGAPRSDKTFFGLHLYLAGKYCKNPKVPGVQLNVNPAWAITWLVGATIYCTFCKNNSPPPGQFLSNIIRLKKINYSKWNAQ